MTSVLFRRAAIAACATASWFVPLPASAQTVPFERALPVTGVVRLDVQTERGRIDVQGGPAGEVRVQGRVSVRVGWNVPANALELARAVAAKPPIEQDASVIRLRPPSDAETRDAVTVAYDVRVPPGTAVTIVSDSGAVLVAHVSAPVDVRTQSSAIAIDRVDATADVRTGSGDVTLSAITGAVHATSQSSAITARGLGGAFTAATGSGRVHATLSGPGDVDVETSSSAITIVGAAGGLAAHTESGAIEINGSPSKAWRVTTGSSGITLHLGPNAAAQLDASTGSGSVEIDRALVSGTVEKRRVSGAIRGGTVPLQITTRSGSIRIQ